MVLTCITCTVAFHEAGQQRDHYKTDWHRYNLKRKVVEMAPVSEAEFESKMALHEAEARMDRQAKADTGYCVACGKSFASDKAYRNHLGSKKHLDIERAFKLKADRSAIEANRMRRTSTRQGEEDVDDNEDMEVEEVDSDEWDEDEEDLEGGDPIPQTDCLFCSHHSSSFDKSLVHMTRDHSFFLPDFEYIVDLDGLVEYLGAKVGQGRMCLWCNERSKRFRTVDAVRKHMTDKGHCKLAFDIAEFADFYDYTSSYPDEGVDEPKDDQAAVELESLDDSGFELVLPSGARIGHRSLMKYYRQSLNPQKEVVIRRPTGRMLDHYRSMGWLGLSSKEAKMKAKDIKFMRSHQQRHYMKLGTKANKLQRHFRDPTM